MPRSSLSPPRWRAFFVVQLATKARSSLATFERIAAGCQILKPLDRGTAVYPGPFLTR